MLFRSPDGRILHAGVRLNYTLISNVSLMVPEMNIPLKLEPCIAGFAAVAGADIKLDGRWYLTVDMKNVQIPSDVTNGLNGAKLSLANSAHGLRGLGIGCRF